LRAALHEAWPSLSYHFGIHPHQVHLFSEAELMRYVEALAEINRASKG
jgi:hypothetical protein